MIFSLNSINHLVFVMKIDGIFCVVITDFLYILVSVKFQMVNEFSELLRSRGHVRGLSKKKPNLLNREPASQHRWLATVALCSGDLKL
jgi:hypothetical protein